MSFTQFTTVAASCLNSTVASPAAQTVENLPAMQETWVRSFGQENPLEKEMATHLSILAWGIPWTEESGRLQSMGRKESDMTEHIHTLLLSGKMQVIT